MNATGFMSNRGCQNIASFLAIDLAHDWQYGGDWFESQLLDYDVYLNWVVHTVHCVVMSSFLSLDISYSFFFASFRTGVLLLGWQEANWTISTLSSRVRIMTSMVIMFVAGFLSWKTSPMNWFMSHGRWHSSNRSNSIVILGWIIQLWLYLHHQSLTMAGQGEAMKRSNGKSNGGQTTATAIAIKNMKWRV